MKRFVKKILNFITCFRFKLPYNCEVHYSSKLKLSTFNGKNKVSSKTVMENTQLGYASYVGMNCKLSNCLIGKYSSIAQNVQIITGKHPTENWVSSHPAFYSSSWIVSYSDENRFDEYEYIDIKKKKHVKIGNDVWIGSNVSILQGINVGDGAIIGAGAVVTKDVPPYAIVVGVPAKLIRYRFEEREREWLNDLKWWDLEETMVKKLAPYFDNIEKFKEIIQSGV